MDNNKHTDYISPMGPLFKEHGERGKDILSKQRQNQNVKRSRDVEMMHSAFFPVSGFTNLFLNFHFNLVFNNVIENPIVLP